MGRKKNDLEPVVLKDDSPTHYTLRYVPGTPMHRRTHAETLVNLKEWADTEAHRLSLPIAKAEELEVVRR
jgi:hypothetical protein